MREHLLLECAALLSDAPQQYAGALDELSKLLLQQLAPAALHPQDPGNAVLALERAFADGLAELERAGYEVAGISLYGYFHRLGSLEKQR